MRRMTTIALLLLLPFALSSQVMAKSERPISPRGADGFYKPTENRSPYFENCVHKYNNLLLTISNWGFFGSEMGGQSDCETGGPAPSGEFPAGSDVEYLFQGSLWIGAVIGEDTLVSVGADGWQYINEMWPCADIDCGIVRRSNRPSDLFYQTDALSDLDYIATYTDTLVATNWTGRDWDGRPHIPLGIQVTQRSYSWSVDYAQDFILLDFQIKNIGRDRIDNLYLGIYSDGDVGHISHELDRYTDDICGYLESVPSSVGHGHRDTINLTYICDNDGDPNSSGVYDYTSATGILGTKVMRVTGEKKVSFNWWQGQGSPQFDWGPMMEATRRNFGTGGLGTPEGDRNKYYMLSNGEEDYNQIYAAENFSDQGWLPPAPVAANIANGGDTRFLLSYGPFNIFMGDSLNLTCAYVAGEALHKDPTANERYMDVNPPRADDFYAKLDFSDVADNAVWASWVYDNPGVDTDGDNNFGSFWEIVDTLPDGTIVVDTFWYAGDGVPDFRAATAPPPPVLRFTTRTGGVTLRWNGLISETAIDPFTKVADFEGYRVYMGRLRALSSMALVESRDFLDYKRFRWDQFLHRWVTRELPLSLDSLRKIYDDPYFLPEDYTCDEDAVGWEPGDGNIYCFGPVDWNQSIEGWQDGAIVTERTGIRKFYADSIKAGLITSEIDIDDTLTSPNWFRDLDPTTGDSIYYHKYFEYEFTIDDVLPSVPWYFSVTTFDFGDFTNNLESMESSPLANVVEIWAMNDASVVEQEGIKPQVYPNPYVGDGRYWDAGYEDPRRSGFVDHERRIHFINLPHKCTIKIFTLSGDLVKELEHPGPESDTDSRVQWNMRSRNNELVASGIYIYSVESNYGNSVGKIVIIL